MAEYIDKRIVADILTPQTYYVRNDYSRAYRQGWKDALELVKLIPAADVVEVVRCKDCEHCSLLFDKRPLCLAGRAWMPITENDFCVWGKKRTDNG